MLITHLVFCYESIITDALSKVLPKLYLAISLTLPFVSSIGDRLGKLWTHGPQMLHGCGPYLMWGAGFVQHGNWLVQAVPHLLHGGPNDGPVDPAFLPALSGEHRWTMLWPLLRPLEYRIYFDVTISLCAPKGTSPSEGHLIMPDHGGLLWDGESDTGLTLFLKLIFFKRQVKGRGSKGLQNPEHRTSWSLLLTLSCLNPYGIHGVICLLGTVCQWV